MKPGSDPRSGVTRVTTSQRFLLGTNRKFREMHRSIPYTCVEVGPNKANAARVLPRVPKLFPLSLSESTHALHRLAFAQSSITAPHSGSGQVGCPYIPPGLGSPLDLLLPGPSGCYVIFSRNLTLGDSLNYHPLCRFLGSESILN